MIAHQHITKIIAGVVAVAVGLCLAAVLFAGELAEALGGGGVAVEYATELFDTDTPMTVNILMNEADWEDMLANATAEEYYQCDVEINGETFYRVGVRPKGNTSLTSIASDPTTDRYSFKLEFDQYVEGQTCYGLDKLVLNNGYADATNNMKEALIYDMFQYLGADASLYNYAVIYVNGEYWGVYLALEAVEDSFLLRNYGAESGELYKPDSMNIGGFSEDMSPPSQGEGGFDFSAFGSPPEDFGGAQGPSGGTDQGEGGGQAAPPEIDMADREDFDFSDFAGGFGGFSMGGGGANLNYTDDDLDSYSTIWAGAKTKTTDSDHRRVVTALEHIAAGEDLETYMDVDNLLRYMAVHVFSVNEDSLSGMMAHNYYLYESDGQLNILPWDYNLALGGMGGMGGGDATSVVNEAIDEAFSGTNFFDTLMENETYRETYYGYLRQLAEEYILGGGFDAFYDRTRSQIDQLVESDPTAFYTYEEYLAAAETFYEVVRLRGESILGQLEGTISSLASEQRGSDALIDASHLDLTVMGTMSMGDGLWDMGPGGGEDSAETVSGAAPPAADSGEDAAAPEGGFDPSQMSGAELPEDFDPSQFGGELSEDFDPSQWEGAPSGETAPDSQADAGTGAASDNPANAEAGTGEDGSSDGDFPRGGFGGGRGGMPGMSAAGQSTSTADSLLLYGVCFAVLLAALAFAVGFRRRPRDR